MRTHCKWGHPWVPENLHSRAGGKYFVCGVCVNEARRKKMKDPTWSRLVRDTSLMDAADPTDWAYVAGMLDADGSIGLYRQRNDVSYITTNVSIANQDLPVLEWMRTTFGGKIHPQHRDKDLHLYVWIPPTPTEEFMIRLTPYLRVKRPQAELMLEYMSSKGFRTDSTREAFIKRSAELNRVNSAKYKESIREFK